MPYWDSVCACAEETFHPCMQILVDGEHTLVPLARIPCDLHMHTTQQGFIQ